MNVREMAADMKDSYASCWIWIVDQINTLPGQTPILRYDDSPAVNQAIMALFERATVNERDAIRFQNEFMRVDHERRDRKQSSVIDTKERRLELAKWFYEKKNFFIGLQDAERVARISFELADAFLAAAGYIDKPCPDSYTKEV